MRREGLAGVHSQRVNRERVMFISSNFGETPKDIRCSKEDLLELMKYLTALPKASVTKMDDLCESGVQLYSVGWVAGHLDDLFSHEELSWLGHFKTEQGLKDYRDIIRAGMRKLEELTDGVSKTFIHGGLQKDNMLSRLICGKNISLSGRSPG